MAELERGKRYWKEVCQSGDILGSWQKKAGRLVRLKQTCKWFRECLGCDEMERGGDTLV